MDQNSCAGVQKRNINGMISGSEREHLDHRISLARNDVDRLPTMCDRIESKCPSILSLRLRQHLKLEI